MKEGNPTIHPPDTPAGKLLSAWWNFGQVMKRRVAPMLEREHGIDFKHFVALAAIDAGATYPSLMCDHLAMTPSNTSRVLEDLTRRDLVRRSLDPDDSRRVRLDITPQGERVLTATRHTMLGLLEHGLDFLSDEQIHAFAETLGRLGDAIREASTTDHPS